MGSILKKLTKAVVDTALIPMDLTRDIVTLGGRIGEKPYTKDRLDHIIKDLKRLYQELED
jgi:hypothetical protein